jgi:NAD(P)-dependent dehydrogenase (short-subunit alcohol dehydrogenase family)
MKMRLENKVAIITGAARGMGADEARLFGREGATVVVADMNDDEGKKVESEIAEAGGKAMFVHVDVTSEENWQELVQQTIANFGRLDILVNNAGLSSGLVSDPLDTDGWHRIMDVNATGGGGSIVNISSIMGFVGGEGGHPAYHASKGAVRIFTKAMAVKYGPQSIRVNSVHPGFMPPMQSSWRADPAIREQLVALTPLRRTGETLEVANGVLFLASDDASFITGTELVIDGGYIAR